MTLIKPERWPYFDFEGQLALPPAMAEAGPAAPLSAHHARKRQRETALRAHFADLHKCFQACLDAVTVCRLSPGGLARLKHGIRPGQKQGCRYRLEDRAAHNGWWQYDRTDDTYGRGKPVAYIGQYILYGRIHTDLARLDVAIDGPHPVGTIVEATAAYTYVQPGCMQHRPYLIHTDGSAKSPRARKQRVFDVMDDSGLETEYVQGYEPDKQDPLLPLLCTVADLVRGRRADRTDRLRHEPAYQEQLRQLKPRLWKPLPGSVVARSAQTPHTGCFADELPEVLAGARPVAPVLRAHIHDLFSRP